jgi:hypothetical protein
MYLIEIHSIHGVEMATEVVKLCNFEIRCEQQRIIIPEVRLIVLVSDGGPADVILGHVTLREHEVYGRLSRYFGKERSAVENTAVKGELQIDRSRQVKSVQGATVSSLSTRVLMGKKATQRVHVSNLLQLETADEPTEELLPEDALASYWQNPKPKTDELEFKVNGTQTDKQQQLALIRRYQDVFAESLSCAKPANVTPMTMEVDYQSFQNDKRSREPTRPQSAARKAAIAKWISQAIADNIIRPSSATAWSQLMLTAKPNGSWRFAIDYRALNKHTKAARAPIPNIRKLLSTIGRNRPKYFAKMDLTSGFYQTPMAEDCMHYTAFDTDLGLFEFTRASMGLLNSPWYFQRTMEQEVFPHLIHKSMEIYIDDLLTWASSIEELLENLEKIFSALREKGLTLNPGKCEFGMSEVEFVGHLIDESGITFTAEKLNQVAKMPLPKTKGELKQFLGLGGYFRNHVADYAEITVVLNGMLEGYEKKTSKQLIDWQPDQIEMFEICQKAIVNCKKLFYEVDDAPIRVYTDASDYGIGAYLCQVLEDETEIPIEFISKTLTKSERKWSTYEKEAFAIFYALRKWETHLKDVKFTLFTDHKNLTYIAKDHNAKVTRWRLAVQDYNFDIAYIPGEENIVADAFSRLCPETIPDEDMKLDTATASIAALTVNLEHFDEWLSVRDFTQDDHVEYAVIAEDVQVFKTLNVETAVCHAIRTDPRRSAPLFEYIPPYRMNIIEQCHNHEVGHFGVNRTIEMLNKMIANDPKYAKLQWKGMRKDVNTYIRRCDSCNKMNEQKLTTHVKKYTTSEDGIMKNLAIDAIYMPTSKSGNKYILTVIDTFTRYTALYAIKDLTAQTAAKTLMNHMHVYGVPDKITSDNSTEFDAQFSEMLDLLKIEKYRIHAYSHQENGIVERANKEIIRHARIIAYEMRNHDGWDDNLLQVQAIMNEKVSEATGLTPNQIIFAGKIDLHAGRIYPNPTNQQRKSMSKYMKDQLDFQDELMRKAEQQQLKTNEKHILSDQAEEYIHRVRDYIVVQPENGKPASKLAARWHGPYRIIEVTTRPQGTVYTCYSPKDGKIADYHASIVKAHPCDNDTEATRIAILDDANTFIIQEIVGHDIVKNNRDKQQLNLQIKWHGYKELEWTGLNMSLKRNVQVQQYLKAKGLEKFGLPPSTEPTAEPQKKRVRFSLSDYEED